MYARFAAMDHQLILMEMGLRIMKTTAPTKQTAQPLAPATLHQAMPGQHAPVMHSVPLAVLQTAIVI